jgi:PAS domain S-box-containing protein
VEDERKTKKQLIAELNELRLEQIEQTRITSEKFTKAFLQNSIPTIITKVKDGSVIEASDAFLRLAGRKRHEVIGHIALKGGFITKEQRVTFFNELKKSGYIENLEMEIYPRDGALRYGLFNTVMMSINNENCLLTTIQDITDRKRVESQMSDTIERLRESEGRYRALFDNSFNCIYTHDLEGNFIDANDATLKILGYSIEDIRGLNFASLLSDDQLALAFIAVQELQETGFQKNLTEYRLHSKNGTDVYVETIGTIIISKGAPTIIQSVARNITERKQAEKALQDSEEKFRLLFNSGKDYMAVHLTGKNGQPGKFIQVNDAACEILGYTREEMLKLLHQDIDSAKSSGQMPALIEKLIENKHILYETKIITKNGDRIPMEVSLTLFSLNDNRATICVARDLTERNRTAEEMHRANILLNTIIENIPSTMFLKDAKDLRFRVFNKAAENLTGYSSADVLGKNDYDFLPKEQADFFTNKDRDVLRGTNVVDIPEEPLQTRNKGQRILHTKKVPIFNMNGEPEYLLGISEDITDRKRAEEILANSQEKYRLIAENIMDCIALVSKDGVIQYVSNTLEPLGYEPEELMNISSLSITHLDDLEQIRTLYRQGIANAWREIAFEMKVRHKNGHYIPMAVRGRTLLDPHGEAMGGFFVARFAEKQMKMEEITLLDQKSPYAPPDLSLREKEILNWVMEGKSTWDVSMILNIGESTVKFHIDKIMKKLSAVNRTHAVAIAMRNELLN